jgi:hypothetical protein
VPRSGDKPTGGGDDAGAGRTDNGSTIRCVECGTAADGTAEGWKAFFGGGFEGEPLEVVVFLPRLRCFRVQRRPLIFAR